MAFIKHPTNIYLDGDELERCAGRLEQIQQATAVAANAQIARAGATMLRLIAVADYRSAEDFVEDYLLTMEWHGGLPEVDE